MRVINVVEINKGILDTIVSFGVIDEQLVNDVVDEAENHYIKCCREHGADIDDWSDDDLIDNESFDNENGYSVWIHWSTIENVQI
jgi:hypothetical protein